MHWLQLHAAMADEFLNNFKIPDYILVPESNVEKFDESDLVVPNCPVLVFVNSKSGGLLGGHLLLTYRTLLNEKQVYMYVSYSKVLHGVFSFPQSSRSWVVCLEPWVESLKLNELSNLNSKINKIQNDLFTSQLFVDTVYRSYQHCVKSIEPYPLEKREVEKRFS